MAVVDDKTALATLESLESRLRRVGFFLSGTEETDDVLQQATSQGKDFTAQARLTRLEGTLAKLSSSSAVVRDLLKLHAIFPDLFQPATSDVPTTLTASEELAIVTSYATSYPTTASRLNAIKDLPIPSAESSASLIALHPRLSKVELQQESQAEEMAELRSRTASAIQRWYELGVLGENECWTEWEGRVTNVEKNVRREEIRQAQDAKEQDAYQS